MNRAKSKGLGDGAEHSKPSFKAFFKKNKKGSVEGDNSPRDSIDSSYAVPAAEPQPQPKPDAQAAPMASADSRGYITIANKVPVAGPGACSGRPARPGAPNASPCPRTVPPCRARPARGPQSPLRTPRWRPPRAPSRYAARGWGLGCRAALPVAQPTPGGAAGNQGR